jgi:quinoprotein dehydrogenase-associated probable ABC transporter substrate-binding protein
MSSASKSGIAAVAIAAALAIGGVAGRGHVEHPGAAAGVAALRVCADPNNLPFSNDHGEGFENQLAEMVAADLGERLEYTWWPQRRGFVRSTLNAGLCDVVIGVPVSYELTLNTRPYYESAYVFVTRHDRGLRLRSFDDPRLRRIAIGVHVVGDDYANVPPAAALAGRRITANVHGYSVYGNYARPSPPADLIDAVGRGDVDIAVAWGPLAGFFASHSPVRLDVDLVPPGPDPGMRFKVAMGVRQGNTALRDRLDEVIALRGHEIEALLARFHVPMVPASEAARAGESE